ncbi:MAG: CPBP family intramembrane metalloprotease [Planctomycetota bacterium]|nr:CPBP family intramembrane metalloprotease [Planctomycetota bacterium]
MSQTSPTATASPGAPPRPRSWALLAVLLVVVMPSITVVNKFYFNLGSVGSAFFLLGKVWVVIIPLVWLHLVERRPWSVSPPRRGGLFPGAILGIAIFAAILGAFILLGPSIDRAAVRGWAQPLGLDNPKLFVAAGVLYCLGNSLMEEFVWRWFVFARLEEFFWPAGKPLPESAGSDPLPAPVLPETNEANADATDNAGEEGELEDELNVEPEVADTRAKAALLAPATPAYTAPIAATRWALRITALLFTAHHALALNSTVIWELTLLASIGVLVGGLAWSWLYQRYRSIWPGYIAHVLADAAIFVGIWPLIAG